jgi:hypothetical protein
VSLLGGRRLRRVGAALVLAGSAATRFSVFKAGFQAAEDPRYVLETQRDGRPSDRLGGTATS